jgi:hypothetical protein
MPTTRVEGQPHPGVAAGRFDERHPGLKGRPGGGSGTEHAHRRTPWPLRQGESSAGDGECGFVIGRRRGGRWWHRVP